MEATILSSGRIVPIEVDGDVFWVIHPYNQYDGMLRQMKLQPVSGPFFLNDSRFRLVEAVG